MPWSRGLDSIRRAAGLLLANSLMPASCLPAGPATRRLSTSGILWTSCSESPQMCHCGRSQTPSPSTAASCLVVPTCPVHHTTCSALPAPISTFSPIWPPTARPTHSATSQPCASRSSHPGQRSRFPTGTTSSDSNRSAASRTTGRTAAIVVPSPSTVRLSSLPFATYSEFPHDQTTLRRPHYGAGPSAARSPACSEARARRPLSRAGARSIPPPSRQGSHGRCCRCRCRATGACRRACR